MSKSFKYGTAVSNQEAPKPKRRLPQYDECLREFLSSGDKMWKVSVEALPSQNIKVVVSSLKWRTEHKKEFRRIKVFTSKNQIFLKKLEYYE